MLARFARLTLIGLTVLALLLPRVSAAVALTGPGAHVVVICTGAGMQTLVIDADGNPVSITHAPEHCLLGDIAGTGERATPDPRPAVTGLALVAPGEDMVAASGPAAARPPPRAPPAA